MHRRVRSSTLLWRVPCHYSPLSPIFVPTTRQPRNSFEKSTHRVALSALTIGPLESILRLVKPGLRLNHDFRQGRGLPCRRCKGLMQCSQAFLFQRKSSANSQLAYEEYLFHNRFDPRHPRSCPQVEGNNTTNTGSCVTAGCGCVDSGSSAKRTSRWMLPRRP